MSVAPAFLAIEGELAVGGGSKRARLYHRVKVERAVDVRVGRGLPRHVLVPNLGADQVGVDDQQQQIGFSLVERVGHEGDLALPSRRG